MGKSVTPLYLKSSMCWVKPSDTYLLAPLQPSFIVDSAIVNSKVVRSNITALTRFVFKRREGKATQFSFYWFCKDTHT